MRKFFAAIFLLLAIVATLFSCVAIREAQYEWKWVEFLRSINCFVAGPSWFIAIFLWGPPTKRAILAGLAISVGMATGLSLFQAALYGAQQRSGRSAACSNQLKQIGLAIQQYEQRYGCLPPAYIADAKGKPIHSWRALLLPFLLESGNQPYSFNEPWDGPNNRKLIDTMTKVYHCPSDSGERGNTSYVAVVGPGTAWPGTSSTRISDMRDGPDKTIWIVEVADSNINCMEPRDLSFDQMDFHINGEPHNSISSCHRNRANVLTADGRVRFLHDTLPPEVVRALLTIAGGEAIPADDLE